LLGFVPSTSATSKATPSEEPTTPKAPSTGSKTVPSAPKAGDEEPTVFTTTFGCNTQP